MHDVFPKAKFRDCIKMTEKCGHQAQLRIMRRQWIEESKPRHVSQQDEDLGDVNELEVVERGGETGSFLSMLYLIASEGP